ncbi:MAG: nickel pincer cofactor biosynthesis protein LarB [Sumerlaeia bacterium]
MTIPSDPALTDLGFAQVDLARVARRGRPEAIFSQGKTPAQVVAIARALAEAGQTALATRTSPEQRDALESALGGTFDVARHDTARLVVVRAQGAETAPRKTGTVGIVCAGTTDMPVAEEAAITAETLGSPVVRHFDIGVAGLHRLLRRLEDIRTCRVLVVVAGMEGALPSVVAGLVQAPVIAVPTSVGYGASFQGVAALLGMLNSCSPGISVVNIDNGYGAGYLADVINGVGE